MAVSIEQPEESERSRSGRRAPFWLRLGGALMQIPILATFLRYIPFVIDDLAGGAVVEALFLTVTLQRLTILAGIIVITVLVYWIFQDQWEADARLGQKLLLFPVLFLTPLWIAFPYLRLMTPWLRISIMAVILIAAALLVIPISWHPDRAPLLAQFMLLTFFGTGIILSAPYRNGTMKSIWTAHSTALKPVTEPEPVQVVTNTSFVEFLQNVMQVIRQAEAGQDAPADLEPIPAADRNFQERAIEVLSGPTEPPRPQQAPVEPEEAEGIDCPKLYLYPDPEGWQVEVLPGDNLWDIAEHFGTTVDELVRLNGPYYPSLRTRPDCIRPPWRLIVTEQGAGD